MKAAVIIPAYNHAGTIERVIADARAAFTDNGHVGEFIVVNDGCTDDTAAILQGINGITVLTHKRNLGKGRALLTGFEYAQKQGCTHAVTLDADGQHEAADAPKLLAVAMTFPEDLIIGERDLDETGCPVPLRSKQGRDAATFWLRVETGERIPDSQCGLRVYPLRYVLAVKYRFKRFDFETEVLARMAWAGVFIRNVPITCIYFTGDRRVSHFRPVIDTLRGVRVNVFLVLRVLIPLPFRRLAGEPPPEFSMGHWWKWQTWHNAFREVLRAGSSNSELSTAIALGSFVGLTPLLGLHSVLAIYFARRLHLNAPAALLGTQVTVAPLVPVWIVVSYGLGNFLLHGHWLASSLHKLSRHMLPSFIVGSMVIAVVVSTLVLFLSRWLLGVFRKERLAREAVS